MVILHSIFYFKSAGHDDKLIIDPEAMISKEALFFISTVLPRHKGKKTNVNSAWEVSNQELVVLNTHTYSQVLVANI